MQQPIFYIAGQTDALRHAKNRLQQWGYVLSPTAGAHVTHLLLPVPSFEHVGILKGGQPLNDVCRLLSKEVTVFGGGLPPMAYRSVDFLKDEFYLRENAQITAQCAAVMLGHRCNLNGAHVLVIGHGRIGRRLVPLLRAKGADVAVAVRKQSDFGDLRACATEAVLCSEWLPARYDVIVNTAPAHVLDADECAPDAVMLDLASVRGIDGDGVLWERGLPNRLDPESSGTLIAKTALRYALKKTNY